MGIRSLSSENIDGSVVISNNEFYKAESTSGTDYKIAGLTSGNMIQIGAIDYTSAGTIFAGGDNISITTGGASGTTRIKINSSGNVGMGTSSPNHKLDIYSNENIPLRIHRPSNSNLNSAGAHGIGFSTRSDAITSTTDTRSGIFSYYNGNLFFATNTSNIESDPDGSARMTILNTGYVGINTTNPLNQFDVRGAVYVTGYTIGFDTSPQGNYAYRFTNDGGNSFINAQGGSLGVDTTSPVSKLEVQSSLNSTNFTGITVTNTEGSGSNLSRAGIAFKAYDWVQSAIWHGRNMSDGNQGALVLGTNPDTSDLTVGGVVGRMYIINNGNVGIGTPSPSDLLHLKKSSGDAALRIETVTGGDPTIIFNSSAANRSGMIKYQDNGTNMGRIEYVHNGDRIAFQAGSATGETMSIKNGAVGIGTTTPDTKLNIGSGGVIRVDSDSTGSNNFLEYYYSASYIQGLAAEGDRGLRMFSQTGDSSAKLTFYTEGSERMRITSIGYVGIGTSDNTATDVNAKLHVYKQAGDNTVAELLRLDCGENNHNVGKGGAIVFRDINVYSDTAKIIAQRRGNTGDSSLQFALRGSEIMRLKNSGDVIIGSDGINSSFGASNTVLAVKGSSSGGEGILQLTGLGNNATDIVSRIEFHSQAETDPMCSIRAIRDNADDEGSLNFLTNNGGSPDTKMRITKLGQILLNTTTALDNRKLRSLGGFSLEGGGYNTSYTSDGLFGATATPNRLFFSGGGRAVLLGYQDNGSGLYAEAMGIETHSTDGLGNTVERNAFIIKNTNSGSHVATISNLGGASFQGNLGVGHVTVTDKLDVTTSASQYAGSFIYGGTNGSYGALRCTLSASNNPSFIDFFRTSYSSSSPVGAIVTGGSNVLYQSFSDYRLKENIADLTGALDKVNNLQPKTFNYINSPEITNEGFLAHELQEVVPQAVSGEKDGMNEDGTPKYQGVDNAHIVPLLVGAIKELKAEIENLKSQIQ